MDVASPKKLQKDYTTPIALVSSNIKKLYNSLYPSIEGYEGTKVRNYIGI